MTSDTVIERWMIKASIDDTGFSNFAEAALLARLVARPVRPGGWVRVSDETCASELGLSTRTIQRMRERLVNRGFLKCSRRRVGDQTLMHYQVIVPAGVRRRRGERAEALRSLLGGPVPVDGTWIVYRHYSADGTLLYVGRTQRFNHRHAGHRSGSSWWPEVCRITVESFPNFEACSAAETAAIRTDGPRENKQGRR